MKLKVSLEPSALRHVAEFDLDVALENAGRQMSDWQAATNEEKMQMIDEFLDDTEASQILFWCPTSFEEIAD